MNMCRNPSSEASPWCYTQSDERWELCDVCPCDQWGRYSMSDVCHMASGVGNHVTHFVLHLCDINVLS